MSLGGFFQKMIRLKSKYRIEESELQKKKKHRKINNTKHAGS